MNKKVLIIVAAVVVVLAVVLGVVLAGGNGGTTTTTKPTTSSTTSSSTTSSSTTSSTTSSSTTTGNNNPNPDPVEDEYTLGMGVAFGSHGTGESNATVAVVVLDKDGKIVSCRLDVAQNKYKFGDDGEIEFTRLESKMELGDAYGMATNPYSPDNNGDGIIKEWYEQAKAFEAYVVGKTVAEVEAMGTQELPNGYVISNDDELLNAGCTIQITEFINAVVKACNDDQAVKFTPNGDFTVGVSVNSGNNSSSADDEDNYVVGMNVEFGAAVVVDGKIVAALNDAYQPVITVEDGEVVSVNVGKKDADGNDLGLMTKRELKENYAMGGKPWSPDNDGDGRVLEWYVQSAAFSAHVVGMTADEVKAMTITNAGGYLISADADLIGAGCTIQITGLQAVVAEAIMYAR